MYLIFIGLYLTLALATVPGSVTTHQREKNAAFCAVGLFDIRVQRIYVKKKKKRIDGNEKKRYTVQGKLDFPQGHSPDTRYG